VVFGWDDIESLEGINFVNQLLGGITNPDSNKGGANVNPNACYASDPQYACGQGTLAGNTGAVTMNGFDMGNHTIDHLESNSTWSGIPSQYKDPMTNGWLFDANGNGPGISMDQQTWQTILQVNDTELKSIYSPGSLVGFRAPRLEVNDNGLNAIKAIGYTYDQNLEEIQADTYIDAAVAADTANKKGFNFLPWPYTLDNGSPGIWNQQATGDKKWVQNFPTGVWEVPVYEVYVPGALGKTIADRMLASDNPSNCTFPAGTPSDQMKHCYLSDGELNPGDSVKEVTGFDFNTFVYCRFTHDDWLAVLKHSFLERYYGNRAPLTYGAHPIEYTAIYDSFTLEQQANNFGYRDVIKYNVYSARQQAMTDFVQWIKSDPTLSKDTYFLSAKQLVDYMNKPFDKTGQPAPADAVATPASNGIFTRLKWVGSGATIKTVSGNAADIVFTVASPDTPVRVTAGVAEGSLAKLSHIDVSYNSDVPFRIRLQTSDGSVSTTALLAGTKSDRVARIRIKDFFPGIETASDQLLAAGLVDAGYAAKVTGISFESAATQVTGAGTFNTHIKQITLHGADTASLCK
jgi:hypothetical protein